MHFNKKLYHIDMHDTKAAAAMGLDNPALRIGDFLLFIK